MVWRPEVRRIFLLVAMPLVLVDLALIGLWTGVLFGAWAGYLDNIVSRRFLITVDGSLGEVFSYLKWMALVVLCHLAWRAGRSPVFLSFAFCFFVILVDDAGQVHERMGWVFEERLGLVPALGLRAKDLGELLTWALLGTAVLAALAVGFTRSPRKDDDAGLALLAVLGALVFCGVVLDMAGIALGAVLPESEWKWVALWAADLAEDGGEMVVGSIGVGLAAAICVSLRALPEQPPLRLRWRGEGYPA